MRIYEKIGKLVITYRECISHPLNHKQIMVAMNKDN
jgi:hypothetical protein